MLHFNKILFFKLKKEKGFTYVELVICLTLFSILVPVIFFTFSNLNFSIKKIINRNALALQYLSFISWFEKEVKEGRDFKVQDNSLTFFLPNNSLVKYELKKRKIFRSVYNSKDRCFKGVTILLDNVYYVIFLNYKNGVYIDLGLQNWYTTIEFSKYIRSFYS